MPNQTIKPEFVEVIPDLIADGVLYISIKYAIAIHKCVCGCGNEVVTPLSQTDWQLLFDGVSVSLYPSIGNWQFECRSHYWVRKNQIRWARSWTADEIQATRDFDRQYKEKYYSEEISPKAKDRGLFTWRIGRKK